MSALTSIAEFAVLAQSAAGEVGSGRIAGGWGYVWTSYGIAWGSIALYSLSLWLRRPKASPGMKE
jgi:hypothetical protein